MRIKKSEGFTVLFLKYKTIKYLLFLMFFNFEKLAF